MVFFAPRMAGVLASKIPLAVLKHRDAKPVLEGLKSLGISGC